MGTTKLPLRVDYLDSQTPRRVWMLLSGPPGLSLCSNPGCCLGSAIPDFQGCTCLTMPSFPSGCCCLEGRTLRGGRIENGLQWLRHTPGAPKLASCRTLIQSKQRIGVSWESGQEGGLKKGVSPPLWMTYRRRRVGFFALGKSMLSTSGWPFACGETMLPMNG